MVLLKPFGKISENSSNIWDCLKGTKHFMLVGDPIYLRAKINKKSNEFLAFVSFA